MRAAIYIRVSTQEQVENYSIESQQERLEAFCKAKGWSIYDTFLDPGFSGASMDRPGLQRLLKEINNIDVVVVYKLDRLSRSQRDTLTLIEDHFLKSRVEFVSVTETLDTSTPFGKAMIGILSVFAQLERETIAERMRMGHIKRAEEGYRVMGGDYDPAGYARKNGDLELKMDEAKHVQEVFNLYERYHSVTKVQKSLKEMGYKVWRIRRYQDILKNKLYCGYVSFAGKYYKGRHQAIITEEQFDRVQVLLARHKGKNAQKAKQSLLSGLIYCGKCGEVYHTYQCRDKDKYYRYYICRARRFPAEYDTGKCMNKIWNYEKIVNLITEEINNLSLDKKATAKKTNKVDYNKALKKIDDKMERIIGLYGDGNMPIEILNKQMTSLEIEKEQLQKKKESQELQQNHTFTEDDLKQYSIDLTIADFNTKQAIVQKLIKQINIFGEDVEIIWNF